MRFLKTLILILFCLGSLTSIAQDIHFTQYNMSPLSLNPANTGAFYGTYRIGGIYRNQWASVISPFSTPLFYIDAPIITGFRKSDWIGIGGAFISDKAGKAKLGSSTFMGSVAYHFALNKKGTSILTLGVQGGKQNRTVSLTGSDIKFYEELDPDMMIKSQDHALGDKAGFIDINAGLMLKTQMNNQTSMVLGFSVNHINNPKVSFGGSGTKDEINLPQRYSGSGEFNFDLNKKWTLSPTFLYQAISTQSEADVQMMGGYKLITTKEKNVKLNFGLGYRVGRNAEILLGMDYDNIKVGFAWDANTSPVTSNFNGGYEIAASYIGKIYKKPKVNPVIFCPRF
ncbi:MAG TPA: PorP/SprF family type IX secretion system membrane protein [Saprospiraceae bacterium]|nr:PorP/SprF family type IX secretion system membrane protein [Saprospiraceae bacterium]